MQELQWLSLVVLNLMLCVTRKCHCADFYTRPTQRPSTDITCWTCPDKSDNDSCNNWAPDLSCPKNHTVCQTLHRFNSISKASILVSKRCAKPSDCTDEHVGCTANARGQEECVSCCDYSYCNQEVAFNLSMAVKLSVFSKVGSTSSGAAITHLNRPLMTLVISLLLVVVRSCALGPRIT